MTDLRGADRKRITSQSELPKGGQLMSIKELNISVKDSEMYGLYNLNDDDKTGHKNVWFLYVETMDHTQRIQLDAKFKRLGYRFIKSAAVTPEILRALYQAKQTESVEESTEKNSLVDFFEDMVGSAMREKVSDIHIEKRKNMAMVRMRRHGQMMLYKELDPEFCNRLCTVMYNVLAEAKDVTFMPTEYQSASVNRRIKGEEVKLRYQSLPVYNDAFDVVLRVLPVGQDDDEAVIDLTRLGYSLSQVKDLMKIISKPVGALIIAGTTGSGKSTTLKNLLMLVNQSREYKCKIYTIEDPPEYKIPKVSQIPVVRRRGEDYTKKSPFYDPLVATMRGDPDILMIGEIRDQFTGDGIKKATQSGHQVLTTTHASSALGTIERFADFGIPPSVMGSPEFINGLVYQKLMPMLCAHCSVPFAKVLEGNDASEADLELAKRLEAVADLKKDGIKIRGRGCDKCDSMGIKGRTVCAEVIAPDYTMLKFFRQQAAIEAKAYWLSLTDGRLDSENMTGKPVLLHAVLKMKRGLVSPHDIEELLGPLDGYHKMREEMERDRLQQAGNAGDRVAQAASVVSAEKPKGSGEKGGKQWDPGY